MKADSSQLTDPDSAYIRELLNSNSRKHFNAALRLALRQVLAGMQVEDHYDRVITAIKREPCYRDLNNSWEKLNPAARGDKWYELMARLVQVAYSGRPYCKRCGECCRQGSPSLHLEDGELLSRGSISTRDLYTLRKGEPVRHSIAGRVDMLSEELIKIKENPESRYCIFYQAHNNSCRIYDHRPLQCRVQECWNPAALEELWKQEKLSRRHLLYHDHDLWELLQAHEERCAPGELHAAFNQVGKTRDLATVDQILDILRKDTVFRTFFIEKLSRDQKEMNFLLGRPMGEIVRVYGMKVEKDDEGVYHLVADR